MPAGLALARMPKMGKSAARPSGNKILAPISGRVSFELA
jgi:hypothetical protein